MAVTETRVRPTCNRCKRPLDLFIDPENGNPNFECGKALGRPAQTDNEFWMAVLVLAPRERAELFRGMK